MDRLLVHPPAAADAAADDLGRRRRRRARVGIGEVDPPGLVKARVKRDVHQAAVLPHPDRRRPGHRRANRPARIEHPQQARALAHQEPAVGQEGQAPRRREPVGHHLDPEPVRLAGAHLAVDEPGPADRCGLQRHARLAQVVHHRANLGRRQQRAEGGHAGGRLPVGDGACQRVVAAAEHPGVVEQRLRLAALQSRAVARRADLGVDLGDVAGSGRRGRCPGRGLPGRDLRAGAGQGDQGQQDDDQRHRDRSQGRRRQSRSKPAIRPVRQVISASTAAHSTRFLLTMRYVPSFHGRGMPSVGIADT